MIASIVIVGASCSGKTTLVDAVRAARLPGVCVPQRFVTRPPRPDDTSDTHIAHGEFERLIANGTIAVHWRRIFEAGRSERYGFAPVEPGTLPVFAANNAICAGVEPAGVLAGALIVGIVAPAAVRARRLRLRSPELPPEEARFRLAETALPIVDVVIDNGDQLACDALVALVRRHARR
jgi:hypothetical protein